MPPTFPLAPCLATPFMFHNSTMPFAAFWLHPTWLQRFFATFAPCLIHSPSLWAWCVHSSLLQVSSPSLRDASFHHCAMSDTNTSPNRQFDTSLMAAAFHHCAMSDTNSSLLGKVCAPIVTAALYLHAMPNTQPFTLGMVGATLTAAAFLLESCLLQTPSC